MVDQTEVRPSDRCLWCHIEVERGEKYCSQACFDEFQDMGHPNWSPAIIYEENRTEDIYKKIRSLDYED
ncbi:MAG: hypothetical protein Q8Q33_02000 [Chlamydiota bacterium]|nr:hypothetical protein [Chlamydiota bacterium]